MAELAKIKTNINGVNGTLTVADSISYRGSYYLGWDSNQFLYFTADGKLLRPDVSPFPPSGIQLNKKGQIKKTDAGIGSICSVQNKVASCLLKINNNDILIDIHESNSCLMFKVSGNCSGHLFALNKNGTMYRHWGVDDTLGFCLNKEGQIKWSK